MKQLAPLFLLAWLTLWPPLAAARPPKPGPKDLCPVCGMLVSQYPNWVAVVTYRDAPAHFFDGPKDMFKYLRTYAPGQRSQHIAGLHVTDFYNLGKIDAHKAFYVIGSDVLGPMGHEFVPLETRADAEEFLTDHKGIRILHFDQVTSGVVDQIDNGKF